MIYNSEKKNIKIICDLIITSARTAPKAKGLDTLIAGIIEEKDKKSILKQMDKMYRETERHLFLRDAQNLQNSQACILFGIENKNIGLNCGACGYSCEELNKLKNRTTEQYNGPNCAFKSIDLGIALGSACRTAVDLCVDNRLMYSVGLAAKLSGVMKADIVIAMPLSVTGKNIFFDRK